MLDCELRRSSVIGRSLKHVFFRLACHKQCAGDAASVPVRSDKFYPGRDHDGVYRETVGRTATVCEIGSVGAIHRWHRISYTSRFSFWQRRTKREAASSPKPATTTCETERPKPDKARQHTKPALARGRCPSSRAPTWLNRPEDVRPEFGPSDGAVSDGFDLHGALSGDPR